MPQGETGGADAVLEQCRWWSGCCAACVRLVGPADADAWRRRWCRCGWSCLRHHELTIFRQLGPGRDLPRRTRSRGRRRTIPIVSACPDRSASRARRRAQQQPDLRQPAVLAAGRGDAAVGHGRRARPTTRRRRPAADARHDRHQAEPRRVARPDADAAPEPTRRRTRRLHFFGTTADGGPAGGDFTLRYDDARRRPSTSSSRTGAAAATPPAHFAIGPLTQRYRDDGRRQRALLASTTSRSTTRSRPRRSSR